MGDQQVLGSALANGVMVMRDGSYHCVPCEKTSSEAVPHLKGRDHYNYLIWYILEQPMPRPELLNTLPAEVREAKLANKIELVNKAHFSYKCRVCPKKNQFTGIEPLKSHLNGNDHKKAEKNMQISSPTVPYPSPMQVSFPVPSQSPTVPYPSPMLPSSYFPTTSQPVQQATPPSVQPELVSALESRVVERRQGSAYKCLVCNNDFTGEAPLLEHLRSNKHKRKISLNISTRSIAADGRNEGSIQLESLRIGVGENDQTDGSRTFPWKVVSTVRPRMPSDTVYRNLSTPRGLVLIFNYYFTGQGEHERKGAKRDSFNLKTLFHSMGYMVYLYEDLTKSETEDKLKYQQENQFLHHFDSFIVFVLSHGKDELHFSCRDGAIMKLKDVRNYFTDNNCPALCNKPKLFFANYCRGRFIEPHMQYDSAPAQQFAPRDMMTLYSCIDSFQAPRHTEQGTVFVQVLCEVLAAHAHDMSMQELIIKINRVTKERKGSTPETQIYDFKTFYFNPYQQ